MLRLAAAVVGFLVTMSLQPVQSASAQTSEAPIPRLVVHARGIAGEPLPLGLTIERGADGAVVIVTGLVPGMTLSTGNALGANVWQVPATDLANTWVGPPKDFVGMVDLIAELQLADATVIHRQPIQIEWVATSPAVAAQVPATTPQPEAIPAPQQIEQDETAMASSENPTTTIKQHGGRTHQKPVASKVTALPVKAKVPQQESNERSPAHMRQSQCDYRGCASAYRSFRASDCTYQPYGGQRRLCEKSARPTDVRERASQVSTQTRAQPCNLDVCAQFYRSFDPSDCTYQPHSGGARKTCDR
jgi:BA14K-like protein